MTKLCCSIQRIEILANLRHS